MLFLAIVAQREQWVVHRRVRERIAERLAPLIDRLVGGEDPKAVAGDLRPVIAGLGRQSRPVAAWLLLDGLGEAGDATRAAVRALLEESGAVSLAEGATRRRMPWRRALACELLGAIGTERSVAVLVPRLGDRRLEVRMAAARALGVLGHPSAGEPLAEAFLHPGRIPTGVVNDALSRLGPAAAPAFRRGLASAEPTVRITSCFGVADNAAAVGAAEVRGLLEARLRGDEEPRVRAAAAAALGWLPAGRAPAPLLDALHDEIPAVRRSAARALAAYDDQAAVAALATAVSDRDRETALRSAESLLALRAGARAGAPARAALGRTRAWALDTAVAVAELAR